MKAAVITIPTRQEALNTLLNVIEPEIPDITIYCDDQFQGHWWNYSRMFKEMLENADQDEPVLLMTDDAITVSGFRKKWESIHWLAQSEIYSLFNRQRHLFKEINIQRSYVTKVQPRGFYDVAAVFINQQALPAQVNKWFENESYENLTPRLRKIREQKSHYDVVVQDYFVYHNISWTITTPTLFDHQPVKSSLGHDHIGGSPRYIGNESL